MMSQEPPPPDKRRGPAVRQTAARFAQRLEPTVVGKVWSRLLEVEFVDRSVALAAKAFVSFLPLLVLVAAMFPDDVRGGNCVGLRRPFRHFRWGLRHGPAGLRDPSANEIGIRSVGGTDHPGVCGVVHHGSSAGLPPRVAPAAGRRRQEQGPRRDVARRRVGADDVRGLVQGRARWTNREVLAWALGLLGSTALWWWTGRLMVRGEIRWRALFPTAVDHGIGGWLYTLAAAVWMPTNVASQYAQFGAFGIAQSFVTWFTGLAFLVVFGAVLGPALADGDNVIARWMRSGNATALEPDAKPALPGPARPMRLSDAFGLGVKSAEAPPAPTGQE